MIDVKSSSVLLGSNCIVKVACWKSAFEHALDTAIMMSSSIGTKVQTLLFTVSKWDAVSRCHLARPGQCSQRVWG